MIWCSPLSTLFPYTTLFRSIRPGLARVRPGERLVRSPEWCLIDVVRVEGMPRCSREIDPRGRSEEHTSELQSRGHLVCRLLLEKKKLINTNTLQMLQLIASI